MIYDYAAVGKHTGENIKLLVDSCFNDYNITNNIRYLVTDNASNMRKAFSVQLTVEEDGVDEADDGLDDPSLWEDHQEIEDAVVELSRGRVRLSCFAHTLQLSIGDGLKVRLLLNLYCF